MLKSATKQVKETKQTKELSDYIDINEIIPDELIKHNPCNLPLSLVGHNKGLLMSYTIRNDLQEHVRKQQENRQNNKHIVGHGSDLFNSTKKKIFLATMIKTFGNKAKACHISRISRQIVHHHINPDSPYFDPIFAQLVDHIRNGILDGHEENIDRQGNNGALIGSFYMLNAHRKEIYGNKTTIVHEKPQLQLDDRKKKIIDLQDYIETKELTSSDEKQE